MEPYDSHELDAELRKHAVTMVQQVHEARDRVERLRQLLSAAEQALEKDERLLEHIQGVMPSATTPTLDVLDERLRGARLREIALQVLESRAQPGQSVHYREWYGWLREEGFAIGGRDPLATFLAQITRVDGVQRVGGARSGRYTLVRS
ncbi:hypothetical protein OJ998_30065 [Solirubrobacter taibaiensis]|nr:hypothetical protein [Solirubrobacter taibaiensis]